MKTISVRNTLLATALAATFTLPAMAQDQGDFLFRIGGGYIATDTSNDDLVFEGINLDNFRADVDDGIGLIFNFSYFVTSNVAVELLAAAPFKHDIDGEGALGPLGKLGRTYHLPPTLSLQYHFRPNQTFRPYAGVGLNWTLFFEDKVNQGTHEGIVATANGALGTDFSGGRSSLDIDDSFGVAFQLGADFAISETWFTNLDVRYIFIDADADIKTRTFDPTGAEQIFRSNLDLSIDPWVVSAAVGFRF
ncbi:MAG: OmpW family outer membrane protein [Wenzhouxiangellaceae bacterium]|nr:OmpW family outer membrane protein [Wenzhouxiangellaceae bacterium]